MTETSLDQTQELFTVNQKAKAMIFVVAGSLEYYCASSREQKEVSQDSFCEMALWLEWEHRGRLLANGACEFILLNARAFHSIVAKSPAAFRICKAYAKLYSERLARSRVDDGEEVSDMWGSFDIAQELVQLACESLEGAHVRTAKFGGFARKQSRGPMMSMKSQGSSYRSGSYFSYGSLLSTLRFSRVISK
eukprot:TRINITY_DN49281_c0_g1_i1.p1 TRINITY_DN49281_c0_g1~~TRINITY_DN49281_c0_g1_i1.p1  ORF type:complete len:192 (-),score=34.19 TRINITY_DN49281_c0_g1_i1:291-866(-)